jgi:S-adenosylmethionine hydrolase
MIALFTDFGLRGPYIGQIHAVLAEQAPGIPVIDLFHSVPNFDIRAGAYLLPAYTQFFPAGTVFLCIVDPGVGGVRRSVFVEADGCRYVGPDNGLFHILVRRAARTDCWLIRWRPPRLSATFHARDLFAPVTAMLARGETPDAASCTLTPPSGSWPDDLPQILYFDHYGNAITGIRAACVSRGTKIRIRRHVLDYARRFSEVSPGRAFWYENANGLVEIAVNRGRADQTLGLSMGETVVIDNK